MVGLPKWLQTRLARKTMLAISSTLFFLIGVELVLHIIGFEYKPRQKGIAKPTVAGFVGTHEFYIKTQMIPPGYIWVSQPNTPYTDKYGFRLPSVTEVRDPKKVRVAFLGGSTTQGGYRPYPERAVRLVNEAIGEERYEALNVACSSYSTHQSAIALERWVIPRRPDLVFIYHGWNDFDVAPDGFSDHEKDFLLRFGGSSEGGTARWVRRFQVTRLVGKVVDRLDTSWPRPRVPPDRFRENLRTMVQRCKDNNIPVMIMIRPRSHRRPLPRYGDLYEQYYRRAYGVFTADEIYEKVHAECTAIQREVAAEFPNATVCDASQFLDRLQLRRDNDVFGANVEVFHGDAIHLTEFGEQKLAELVAVSMAPQYEDAIGDWIHDADYHEELAREFEEEEHPFEAVYHARRAIARDPARAAQLEGLIGEAEGDYEFVRLFREARWGGTDNDLASRFVKLMRCLVLKPNDTGIREQVFRVATGMGVEQNSAQMLAQFTPPVHLEGVTPLIDGDADTPWVSANRDEDTAFYISYPEPVKLAGFAIIMLRTAEGLCLRDFSIVATNDDPSQNPSWHLIRARAGPSMPFDKKITVPGDLPDKGIVVVRIDMTDRDMLRDYKHWGLVCLSRGQGYERNYCGPNNHVIGVRELIASVR